MSRALAVVVAIAALLVPLRVGGNPDHGLDLARIVAHESSLDASPDEVAAIHAVAMERCRGCSTSTAVRIVSRRFFAGQTSRPYYLTLTRDGREPAQWPARASWARYRARWLALLAVADAVVAGEIEARCSPQAWGGDIDAERARRLRLIEVDCGDTANSYFLYPGTGASRD